MNKILALESMAVSDYSNHTTFHKLSTTAACSERPSHFARKLIYQNFLSTLKYHFLDIRQTKVNDLARHTKWNKVAGLS